MSVSKFFVRALLAAAGFAVATSDARADLFIRVTVLSSTNTVLGSGTATSTSSPLSPDFGPINGFSNITAGLTLSTAAGNTTINGLTNAFTLSSDGSLTNKIVFEYLTTGNTMPNGPTVLMENGSPSSTFPFGASTVTLTSGIMTGVTSLAGIATPTAPNTAPAGFTAIATASGAYVPGASSTLVPNPSSGASSGIASPFGFYQVYFVSGFTAAGSGSFSGQSSVNANAPPHPPVVPEPATIVSALIGLGGLGLAKLRRRKTAVVA